MDARDLVSVVGVWSSNAWDHTFTGGREGDQLILGPYRHWGGDQLILDPDTYVYMYVCTSVRLYLCTCAHMHVCIHL